MKTTAKLHPFFVKKTAFCVRINTIKIRMRFVQRGKPVVRHHGSLNHSDLFGLGS